ncbi:WYL domain-containing protein [Microterricola pindariensis]|uniref:WYL domain-containing protein n=1 Tax=Microterricola pindariensis TaxID=478010 RepID=A0ABX5AVU7_9MICO|nr:WYL domain-containing protein [Microterricola pindariensis]
MEAGGVVAVSVEERLFSLVLALLASEQGLGKAEILSTVQGYRQRYVLGGDNASLDRQFERDKDDIRELGIPLETIDAPDRPGDSQSARYRIPRALYELPADVTFSAAENALLGLAAAVWRDGSLSEDSRRAITKLRSLGIETDDAVIGYAPRLRVREAAFGPLKLALDRRQRVSFLYLKPGQKKPLLRTVDPHALVVHESRWHLSGFDKRARAPRTFLLSRIVGPVKPLPGETFDAPAAGAAERSLAELQRVWQGNVAVLGIVAGSDAGLRLLKRSGVSPTDSGRYELHFTDLDILADELAGFGPEVLVHAPAELRAAVRSRLLQVSGTHQDGGNA